MGQSKVQIKILYKGALMSVLTQVLGELFSVSYGIAKNYILAMVVFTIMTKILLLPVSIWTQKNGIKMVKMQPELNAIKVKFFGDKETIGDETAALYKREKYNAFVDVVPLLIQIVILICIIDVVREPVYTGLTIADMEFFQIAFYAYPYLQGGLYWAMPFLAGASAFLLSIVQNKLNPLQNAQTQKSQLGTMSMSVGISLILGAFVPTGVGLYWICSNLLTIPVQLLLNCIINPKKYVDYTLLEESQKQLEALQHIGSQEKNNKQLKKRERLDYKRFFSVANKHLVFYSENNGFYKYFETTIDYLLTNSNLTIHYITSDPKDQIFQKENPRIRGYYIGENRLITLMMKLEADMVVMTMPDLENYHLKRSYIKKDVEYVYMFHYPLSTHMVLSASALDHYDTILCVGKFQFNEIRKREELKSLPAKKLVACGYGQLEKLQQQYDKSSHEKRAVAQVLIAPSWQKDNILDSCIDDLLTELLGKELDIIIRPHPEYMKRYKDKMSAIEKRYASQVGNGLRFELDFTSNHSIFDSDIVITDWSGTAYEFTFVTGKPAVFIDTPMKVNNLGYQELGIEPLEISLRDQVGIRLTPTNLAGCYNKIENLLKNQEQYITKNIMLRNEYIANYGYSGEVAGNYIISSLQEKIAQKKA